jgi:hypothetical protein
VHGFYYKNDSLHCEEVELYTLAEEYGTPLYVYSAATILDRYRRLDAALNGVTHEVAYAVKANSNLSVLRLLANDGAGFDIVSAGELYQPPCPRPPLRPNGTSRGLLQNAIPSSQPESRRLMSKQNSPLGSPAMPRWSLPPERKVTPKSRALARYFGSKKITGAWPCVVTGTWRVPALAPDCDASV